MLNGAVPPFDLGDGGVLLAIVRSLSVASLMSVYGVLVFRCLVAPKALDRMSPEIVQVVDRRLWRFAWFSLVLAVAAAIGWLAFQTAVIADAKTFSETATALPTVLFRMSFGHAILVKLAALVGAGVALGRARHILRWRLAAALSVVAMASQAGSSHALSMFGAVSFLFASDVVHLLSAGAWLGGLLPLLVVVRSAPFKPAAVACRYFSPLGKLCIAGMVVSAIYQGWVLIGSIPGLVGTAYGWMALLKGVGLALLVGFAALNRYRLAPALLHDEPVRAKRLLVRSIALQTVAGLLVVAAAGTLSSLPPAIHLQPVWPFTDQPSLVTVREDPDFGREVAEAVLALAGAMALVAAGIAVRRLRWPAIAVSLVIAWLAVPHLGLLFARAYPTSYYHSPTGFAAATIVVGAALYPRHCAGCHGIEGRGDGPLAQELPAPPADLTAPHLWAHSDGELYWWLSHGIEAPEGGLAMPGFADQLDDGQRWALIDFIRARNAGIGRMANGTWPLPVRAPGFEAECRDGRTVTLDQLQGKVVFLAFQTEASAPLPQVPADVPVDTVTVIVPPVSAAHVPTKACATGDAAVRQAYQIVSGLAPETLAGTRFLIDPNGWLRAMQGPDGPAIGVPDGGWDDPEVLLAEIRQICTHPIRTTEAAHAHHK
ncbi:MAG TPA: CopD family protein [Stellaceae bacterium]|nr:CopD family protein [Stellaceae bacterium]